jgi:hypothetical protein
MLQEWLLTPHQAVAVAVAVALTVLTDSSALAVAVAVEDLHLVVKAEMAEVARL